MPTVTDSAIYGIFNQIREFCAKIPRMNAIDIIALLVPMRPAMVSAAARPSGVGRRGKRNERGALLFSHAVWRGWGRL